MTTGNVVECTTASRDKSRSRPYTLLYRLHAVGAKRRRQLMRTHLTQVTPGATFLQLVPIGGWAEVAAYATPFVPSCPCGGPGCAFCH